MMRILHKYCDEDFLAITVDNTFEQHHYDDLND